MVVIAAHEARNAAVTYQPQKLFYTITPTPGPHGSIAPSNPNRLGLGFPRRSR